MKTKPKNIVNTGKGNYFKKLLLISSLIAFMAISNSAKAQSIFVVGTDVTNCSSYIINICDASNTVLASITVSPGTSNSTSPPPPTCLSLTGIDHIDVIGNSQTRTFGSAGVFTNQSLAGVCAPFNNMNLTVNTPSCGTGSLNLQFNFN